MQQPQENQARPIVACLRCREQKLKCGRELPTCERCLKQRAMCTYPPPPDRKRIAQNTNRAKASQSISEKYIHPPESSSPATNTAKKRRFSQEASGPFLCLEDPEAAELPSTEIGLLLQEIFYKRAYNANLMFHKNVSFQVYMLKKTPEYVQRAVFAFAAIFLQQVDPSLRERIKIFPMQELCDKSWSWAHAASVEVLSHVDEPSLLKIQTLQILQLYYYARGEIARAKVHSSLAYQLSRLLGYDKLYESEDPSLISPSLRFDREIRRRSFWASWCTMCIGSDDQTSTQLCAIAVGLPLPARYGPGGSIQGVEVIHGQKMSNDWILQDDSTNNGNLTSSLMAELVKLAGVWTQVRRFVSESPSDPFPQKTRAFQQLNEQLDDIERSMHLPITDLLTSAASYEESPELLVSFCSVFHLSRLLTHASMVPALSQIESPLPLGTANPSIQKSTEIVLDQALYFTALLQRLVAQGLDITMLWPFTGHAAFMVGYLFLLCNIMLQSNGSLNERFQVPGPGSEQIKTLRTVLEVLSIYWKPLRPWNTKLSEAIEASRMNDAGLRITPTILKDHVNFFSGGEPL